MTSRDTIHPSCPLPGTHCWYHPGYCYSSPLLVLLSVLRLLLAAVVVAMTTRWLIVLAPW